MSMQRCSNVWFIYSLINLINSVAISLLIWVLFITSFTIIDILHRVESGVLTWSKATATTLSSLFVKFIMAIMAQFKFRSLVYLCIVQLQIGIWKNTSSKETYKVNITTRKTPECDPVLSCIWSSYVYIWK